MQYLFNSKGTHIANFVNDQLYAPFGENIGHYMKNNGIPPTFHYIPLHSSPAGMQFGRFHGEDKYTTKESERLARLPMYYGLKDEEVQYIISKVKEFYK